MAKKKWTIPVIALVLGMVVLGACRSGPRAFEELETRLMPDDQSAMVYFCYKLSIPVSIWDGEKPVGYLDAKHIPRFWGTAMYKTTPGEHYFMFNATNWIAMRAELEAGKRYLVIVHDMNFPMPPRTFFVDATEGYVDSEDIYMNHKYASFIVFTDSWRADFINEKKGGIFMEAQENLRDAQNRNMEVTLTREHGY